MSFFAELPPQSPRERPASPPVPEWVQPPKDEIPVAVPAVRRLARIPGVALSLRRCDVYRAGVAIELQLDLWREPGLDPERWAQLCDVLHPHGWYPPESAGQLRLGVTLADGTRAEGCRRGVRGPMRERPAPPSLVVLGGGGGGTEDRQTSEVRAWLWPLPPAGPLTLHFVCEGLGIAEGSLELDTAPILAASAEALDLWAH